jgi:hypothetical protein
MSGQYAPLEVYAEVVSGHLLPVVTWFVPKFSVDRKPLSWSLLFAELRSTTINAQVAVTIVKFAGPVMGAHTCCGSLRCGARRAT